MTTPRYEPPRLSVLGSVTQVTSGTLTGSTLDGVLFILRGNPVVVSSAR